MTTWSGPIDYLVLEFPQQKVGVTLRAILDLVDNGLIYPLDMRVIRRAYDGSFEPVTLADLAEVGEDEIRAFAGFESGLVDDDDLGEAARIVAPGSVAGILVYENAWAAPLIDAAHDSGTHLVANGRIALDRLNDALDRLDNASRRQETTTWHSSSRSTVTNSLRPTRACCANG